MTPPDDQTRIRPAIDDDVDELASVLAEALLDDPPNVWSIPDRGARRSVMPGFFRLFVEASVAAGRALALEDRSGVCLWFPPGWEMGGEGPETFETRAREVLAEVLPGPLAIVEAIEPHHPSTPAHYYLAFVAIRPERQGLGLGSALIRHGLDRCDGEVRPAYLEATSERNRGLYERLGFAVRSEIHLPDGPTLWAMWREPRVGASSQAGS
jgi:ribosomal protein S18 acetylase RimI-like enzyme